MLCKHCGQKISTNASTKCPYCGAVINIYDYGQSFYEDRELDAWQDASPNGNVKKTVMLDPKMDPTISRSSRASGGKHRNPEAAGGAVGFFSKYKIPIIVSSISFMLVVVMAVILAVKLIPDKDVTPPPPVPEPQLQQEVVSVHEILTSVGCEVITSEYKSIEKNKVVRIVLSDAMQTQYLIECVIGGNAFYIINVGENSDEIREIVSLDVNSDFKYYDDIDGDAVDKIKVDKDSFIKALKQKEISINEEVAILPEDSSASNGQIPDNSTSSQPENKEDLVSFYEVLSNNGFNVNNRIQPSKDDVDDFAWAITINLESKQMQYRYRKRDHSSGTGLKTYTFKTIKIVDDIIYLSKEEAEECIQMILNEKNEWMEKQS